MHLTTALRAAGSLARGRGEAPPRRCAALAALLLAATLGGGACGPGARPPHLGEVPAFRLVDQRGRSFASEDLRGKVWIASFFFTSCPTTCPRITGTLATVERDTRDLGSALHFVSITVDPARDGPDALLAYARKWEAPEERWTFLTGPAQDVERAVVTGFKMAMGDAAAGGDPAAVLHGTHFVLVDGRGSIRGYHSSSDPEAIESLVAAARHLVANGG